MDVRGLYPQKKGEQPQHKMVTLGKVHFFVVRQMTTQPEKKERKSIKFYLEENSNVLSTTSVTILVYSVSSVQKKPRGLAQDMSEMVQKH